MDAMLTENLSDEVLKRYFEVTREDVERLRTTRDAGHGAFTHAILSLTDAFDDQRTYAGEMMMATSGNSQVQEAVEILESYMDSAIVESENKSHRTLAMWKWGTIIGGGLGLLFTLNGARDLRQRILRREYYGY